MVRCEEQDNEEPEVGVAHRTSDGLTQCAALRKGLVANTAVHQEREPDLRQTGRHKGTAGRIWVPESPGTDTIPCVRSQREFVSLMHLCHRM